ncbi:rubrerythrin [Mariprofundus sp. EBB-1]|uniref:rubrerythrin family protein n=1 Tax=Mariprofundus sp. EBB-1 TaxID=2650971 RepID=UPI000EF22D44|nr:ferritin family protein [Mariprofundus sp. EBB-1]RLL52207.1 rubrerythrin [Mariprofundus sp. EBB-1]
MGSARFCATFQAYVLIALVTGFGNSAIVQAAEKEAPQYPETIAVLSMLYASEVKAGYRYQLYTKAALVEGHDNIAHLLSAMAVSEAVHAKSFKYLLSLMDVVPAEVDLSAINASKTKDNLKFATEVELSEIDKEYPLFLKRIKPEGHAEAIRNIEFAWQAEKQHRALIKEIKGGTGMFFGMLLKYFRKNPTHYYVNDVCGATVTEMPEDKCPICHNPIITYREIPKPEL